jgi:hypothetical protein
LVLIPKALPGFSAATLKREKRPCTDYNDEMPRSDSHGDLDLDGKGRPPIPSGSGPLNPPSLAQIDAVLKHLPVFQRPNVPLGSRDELEHNEDGSFSAGIWEDSSEISKLISDLYENGFIVSFDWGRWQKQAEQYFLHPERLRSASLCDLQKLLITHVRKERFCEGHFSVMVVHGHIRGILERLAEIRNSQGFSEKL